VERFENLEIVCNIRENTALYRILPARTGKKGHPKKHGSQIRLENIILSEPEDSDW